MASKHVTIRCGSCRQTRRFLKKRRPRSGWLCDPCKARTYSNIDAILSPPAEPVVRERRSKGGRAGYIPRPYSQTMSAKGTNIVLGFVPLNDDGTLHKEPPAPPKPRRIINASRWIGSGSYEVEAQGRR